MSRSGGNGSISQGSRPGRRRGCALVSPRVCYSIRRCWRAPFSRNFGQRKRHKDPVKASGQVTLDRAIRVRTRANAGSGPRRALVRGAVVFRGAYTIAGEDFARRVRRARPSSREARGRRTRAPAYGGGDRVTPAATLRLRGARLPMTHIHHRPRRDRRGTHPATGPRIESRRSPEWPASPRSGIVLFPG